ncbi:MAG: DUF1573 domain-containing protein [Prevotella sp.]|nr:DUF1573 domain-containing protein [Prevotella sp.]
MKKFLMITLLLICGMSFAAAQGKADIKFDQLEHDFGTFSEATPVQNTTFTFTNVGNAPLVINQVVASCGCVVSKYDKQPILPGKKGSISVRYNGTGKFAGHFKKTITVFSNAKVEMTRLSIEGTMTEKK